MLRVVGVAGVLFGLSGLMATAQAANDPLIVWQGGATITSLNTTCKTNLPGINVGDLAHSVFRPRLVGDEPSSALSLLFGRFAQAFFRTSGGGDQMHGIGSYTGPLIRGRVTSVPGGATGTYNFKIKPAVIDATTGVITIEGTINDFGGTPGCTMKFVAAYQPRGN